MRLRSSISFEFIPYDDFTKRYIEIVIENNEDDYKTDIKNKTVVIIASGGNVDPDIFEKSLKTSI